jgi:hypothetical protein
MLNIHIKKEAVKVMWSALTLGAIVLVIVIIWEIAIPTRIKDSISEGFTSQSSTLLNDIYPIRGDIGDNIEQDGYHQDPRYFHGYADVQSIGKQRDYCRMIFPISTFTAEQDNLESFFACALAGTEGLSSVRYRTPSVKQGFIRSRDDYMRDVAGDKKEAYCSIIKTDTGFEPKCYRALETEFGKIQMTDANPPENISRLLRFYNGIIGWIRLRDDMKDYAQNLTITNSGKMEIDEEPNPKVTQGLKFNGIDQYLRIGENTNLVFESKIPLRFLRAVSVWVKFDEFTNNARIFDFGSGPNNNNIILGIIGRGDGGVDTGTIRSDLLCDKEEGKTVPEAPSGAQRCPEVSAKTLMENSSANVDDWTCPFPEIEGKKVKKLRNYDPPTGKTATLLYEVWEQQRRAMTIKVPAAVKVGVWTHIAVTAFNMDSMKPDIGIYVNGELVYTKPSGVLPQTSFTERNYIGKSNWAEQTSSSDNKDELFKGSMFDFRMYATNMSKDKVKDTYNWGKDLLGLSYK